MPFQFDLVTISSAADISIAQPHLQQYQNNIKCVRDIFSTPNPQNKWTMYVKGAKNKQSRWFPMFYCSMFKRLFCQKAYKNIYVLFIQIYYSFNQNSIDVCTISNE